MRILFLSRWFPFPPNNGSKLRIYNLLRGLGMHHAVTLVTFADELNAQPDLTSIQGICEETYLAPWKGYDPSSESARRGFFSLRPRSVVDTYSPAMADRISACLLLHDYDLVIASQLATAAYVEHFGRLPALLEEVELGVLREQYVRAASIHHRIRYRLTWMKHRHYVAELLRRFEVCTVVSEREHDLVTAITRSSVPVEIIPNCVNLADYQGVQAPRLDNSLVFTGPFRYTANYDAMTWFLRAVYPAIQAQIPDVTLTITGDHADLPLPAATNVTLTGQVPDVLPLVAGAACSVVPLQSGGGTRLKILEAMALGTPVVSTSKGAEGLDVQHDVHLLIADTPDEFAGAVIRLLQQPDLPRRLRGNALRLVREQYDWAGVMPRFLELAEGAAHVQRAA